MEPRTKIERELVSLAPTLRPLTRYQQEWVARLIPDEAYYYSRRGKKSNMHCLQCGHVHTLEYKWDVDGKVIPKWTCPECGAVCDVLPQYHGYFGNYDLKSGRRSLRATDEACATLADRHGDWQVFRTFAAEKCRKADGGYEITVHERFQNWISPKGKEHIIRQNYDRMYSHIQWRYDKGWGVGKHNPTCSGYWYMDDMFRLDGAWLIPGGRVTPLLRRNGWTRKLVMVKPNGNPAGTAIALLQNAGVEKIVKMGQTALAAHVIDNRFWYEKADELVPVVRICTRHGYAVSNPSTWLDYVNMLREAGRDLRNPVFVCPEDLTEAHDRILTAVEKIRRLKEEKANLKLAKEWEGHYREAKKAYLGIVFGDEDVTISVIPTVKAVMEEGQSMHHCVFRAEYYKREDSLLLSARDNDGNRLETIEINLDKMRVEQSRGLQNNPSPRHEEILRLCEENMNVIRQAKAGRVVAVA